MHPGEICVDARNEKKPVACLVTRADDYGMRTRRYRNRLSYRM
jgi:hypothetical protein